MSTGERRWDIVQEIYSKKVVTFHDLCQALPHCQPTTLSNELRLLVLLGVVCKRGHGRYSTADSVLAVGGKENKFQLRTSLLAREKRAIAAHLVESLGNVTSLALDGGTQIAAVAVEIAAHLSDFHIFTCNWAAAEILRHSSTAASITVRHGKLDPDYAVIVGPVTDQDKAIMSEVAILGVSGITPQGGLSTLDSSQHDFKRWLVSSSTRVLIPATHEKVGRRRGVEFARLLDPGLDLRIITDNNRGTMTEAEVRDWQGTIQALGNRIVVVDHNGQAVDSKLVAWDDPKPPE